MRHELEEYLYSLADHSETLDLGSLPATAGASGKHLASRRQLASRILAL
jgi:hypothetical protein